MSDVGEIYDAGLSPISEEEYCVETILNKRVKLGVVEYFIKWKGYGDKYNTWEREKNLNFCKHIIKKFEDDLKEREYKGLLSNTTAINDVIPGSSDASPQIEPVTDDGFMDENAADWSTLLQSDRVIDSIIGMTNEGGQLFFLLKWVDSQEADLVLAKEVNRINPQIVIKYYEEHISWDI